MLKQLLKNNNLKVTKQRLELLNIINELNDESTIKNIIDKCPDIDKSTIYRIIELLIDKNIIEKELNIDNEVYFHIKEKHSHYVTCIKCHKKEKIDLCICNDINTNLEKEGYEIINHKIEVMGICANCK